MELDYSKTFQEISEFSQKYFENKGLGKYWSEVYNEETHEDIKNEYENYRNNKDLEGFSRAIITRVLNRKDMR